MNLATLAYILLTFSILAGTMPAQRKRTSRKPPATTRQPSIDPDLEEFVVRDGWVTAGETKISKFLYNPSRISSTSRGTKKIWIKETFNESFLEWRASVRTLRKEAGVEDVDRKYTFKLSHVLLMYEIDCDKEQMRLLNSVDYDSDGTVINSFAFSDEVRWRAIVPESVGESFSKIACSR